MRGVVELVNTLFAEDILHACTWLVWNFDSRDMFHFQGRKKLYPDLFGKMFANKKSFTLLF